MSSEPDHQNQGHGMVAGAPLLVLRGEGLLVLVPATYAYSQMAQSWWTFALLFFAPDVFMLGYLRNTLFGSIIYNLGHTYVVPTVLLLMAQASAQSAALAVSLIWIAHIGFDRALGYGLKYRSDFKHTHLSSST